MGLLEVGVAVAARQTIEAGYQQLRGEAYQRLYDVTVLAVRQLQTVGDAEALFRIIPGECSDLRRYVADKWSCLCVNECDVEHMGKVLQLLHPHNSNLAVHQDHALARVAHQGCGDRPATQDISMPGSSRFTKFLLWLRRLGLKNSA